MQYRAEIDGLRAFAVVPVILFHAGFSVFRGGFVGVDVFFVISGYLITSILLDEMGQGRFSIVGFYERRARRILPALFFVMACCVPVAWLWLMPQELKEFAQSLMAVTLFVSNVLFWSQSGYFDTAAELKPLLHTWSLAVEEQYYILFPLCLMALFRLGKRVVIALLLAVSVLSLGIAHWGAHAKPTAAFFLLPTRAWELLLGAAAACWLDGQPRLQFGAAIGRWLSLCGLVLIGVSAFVFDRNTPFPSAYTLLPVLGTVLVILFAAPGGLAHRILASRPLVGIGLISYSAYLWHQPLFAFARNIVSLEPGVPLMLLLTAATLVLAALSWRFVEKPFRDPRRIARRPIFVASGAAMVVFFALGWMGHANEGFESRLNLQPRFAGDIGHLTFHQHVADRYAVCTPSRIADAALRWEHYIRCMQSKADRPVDVALVGDSHAEHLFLGLADALPVHNVAFYIKGSAPLAGNPQFDDIFRHVLTSDAIRTVILTMHWHGRLDQIPPATGFEAAVFQTLEPLVKAGKSVYLVEDVPQFDFQPERCQFVKSAIRKPVCDMPSGKVDADEARYRQGLLSVVKRLPGVRLIRLRDIFCSESSCSMVQQGSLMYRDSHHLNILGSLLAGRRIASEMGRAGL